MSKTIIHDLVVKRIAMKSVIDKLNSELKAEKKGLMELDENLLKEMNEAKQSLTRIDGFTVSVNQQELFTPTDWTIFGEYVEANKLTHLYQRRLTQKAVEEAVKLYGSEVPVEKYTKRSISVRKVAGKI